MEPISIAAIIERLCAMDGDRAKAQRKLADALEDLDWPVREAYTPPEVMRLAATIGRRAAAAGTGLAPGEARTLVLELAPALDDLEAFARSVA